VQASSKEHGEIVGMDGNGIGGAGRGRPHAECCGGLRRQDVGVHPVHLLAVVAGRLRDAVDLRVEDPR